MSRNVILYLAMSVDGYIADERGGVGWLDDYAPPDGEGAGYRALLSRIDTVVMGRRTYDQIVTELSPGQWVYDGLQSYVLTHEPRQNLPEITFTDKPACELLKTLRQEPGKDIWICGGAMVARQLAEQGLIDEYELTIVPVVLGGGVRLFGGGRTQRLAFMGSRQENGLVTLRFCRAGRD